MAAARVPKAKPATVNDTLRDRGLAHAVMLERLKANEAAAIRQHYQDEVVPDLVEQLTKRLAAIQARGYDLKPATTDRLSDLLSFMQEAVDAWTSGLAADLSDRTADTANSEVRWQDDLIQSVLPIEWDTLVPPVATVRAAVLEAPIDGTLLEDIVGRLGAGAKLALERAIRIGITEGESVPAITARVQRATDFAGTTAEAVTRTAIGHASNAGRAAYYQANADIIAGVQWHATLDTRTCASCAVLDGKVYPLDSGPRPPRHILCRCTSVPVLKGLAALGLKIDKFPAGTRASMNGQVSASTTYGAWLSRQSSEMQNEALGPTRGALYRTGQLTIADFVSRAGDPYNLDQLRQREADVFATAGV